jgi:signal peptidase I
MPRRNRRASPSRPGSARMNPVPNPENSSPDSPGKKSTAREYLESFVVAFILALFVRTFVVQAFKIPSGSMETNLLIGDHLLVNKLVFSPSGGALERALCPTRSIRRGDVIVFKYPKDPQKDYIKRVIGLPGETVEVRGRVVYVDGQALQEPYTHYLGTSGRPDDQERVLIGGGERAEWGPQQVPAGQLFVMGDNRDNSADSRYWGFLPSDQVRGRALMVYWSYEATRAEYDRERFSDWLWDTATALKRTRWRRFFHLIR